ncbi:MAG: recombinase family protein [bacterium]|nr:recombinase family protein [bacterium]
MARRVALYARVSTRDQHPDAQLGRLRTWAEHADLEPVEFVDNGQSGRKAERPALRELLNAVRRHEVEVVATVKLDRLARSTRNLCELADVFEASNVDLVCLDQAVDTRTAAGRLLYRVLGAFSEFEADLIRERTLDGLAAARRRGKRIGRPRALGCEGVARAQRMHSKGRSLSQIAAVLGVSKATIHRVLRGSQGGERGKRLESDRRSAIG